MTITASELRQNIYRIPDHVMNRRRLFIAILLVAIVAITAYSKRERIQILRDKYRVETLLAQYESQPSQDAANRLWRLLDERILDQDKGSQALQALMAVETRQRSVYRSDKIVCIYFQPHFEIPTRYGQNILYISVQPEMADRILPGIGYNGSFNRQWQTAQFDKPGSGDRVGYIVLRCHVIPRNGDMDTIFYKAERRVPVAFKVADPAHAECIELINHPDLKKQMEQAVSIEDHREQRGYVGGSYNIKTEHLPLIVFKTLPIDVCFRGEFISAEGKVSPLEHCKIRDFQGNTIGYLPHVPDITTQPGKVSGTLRLIPDPEYAYNDPGIKRIYGEVMEFPITFEVQDRKE